MAIKRPTYQEYDEYIYDYETTNASFIAMASILYRKGIKNYNFFLKLYDEDLVGVDPYDPSLSLQMKMKVLYECKRNFWYFAREVMIIPGTGRFELHRGNLAAAWALLNNIPTYLVLPRQHGKTWLVITFALWVFNFGSDYTNMLFMNKQLKDSQLNLKRLKQARDVLPDYLQMKLVDNGRGEMKEARNNVNSASNGLKNEITVTSSARNPLAADDLGRGMSVAWIWVDELAFVQFMRIIYAAMTPAWSKAASIARKKGKPVARILTTTPGDLAVDHGLFAHEIRENSGWFSESLYDYSASDLSTWMSKNSRYGYMYIEFMYYQLNHSDPEAWFREQCQELVYNWPKIRREILLQWNSASSNSPFDEEDIKELRSMLIKPSDSKSIMINKYYRLNVYRKLNPEDKYLINVDTAKGRGNMADNTAIVVTNAKTHKIHAIFKSNTIQYKETFRFLYTLVYQHIPNCVLIVENNIDTVIEYIKNSPMKHLLYYEFPDKADRDKRKKGITQPKNRDTVVYGLNTSAQSRPKYFDILFEYVRNNKDYICCEEMISEIETLEYKSETRIEAISGKHDDVIMAYLLGEYVMHHGKNKPRFGLYYSEGLGEEYKATNSNVFKATDYNTSKVKRTYDNPFLNELFRPFDTLEDLDRRWKNTMNRYENNGRAIYGTNVFTGETDVVGVKVAAPDAFKQLNQINPYDVLSAGEEFGVNTDTPLDFMEDIDNVFGV